MSKKQNSIEEVNAWAHNRIQEFSQKILQVSGHKNRAQCPFHKSADQDMGYNPKTGLWKCFGSCDTVFGDSTTVATLLRKNISIEKWSTLKPVEKVKKKLEVSQQILDEYQTGKYKAVDFTNESFDIIKESEQSDTPWEKNFPGIAILFRKRFYEKLSSREATLRFFNEFKPNESWKRFKKETMKLFKVYEPTSEAPLFLQNFHLYMLHDEYGKVISFQGRRKEIPTMPDFMKKIKMYNLPDTPVEKIVYGLSLIRRGETHRCIKDGDHYKVNALVLVEGQGDVLRTYENGFPSVSFLGKEASDTQIETSLKYLAKNGEVIVFFDNDEPGKKASKKVAEKFIQFKNRNDITVSIAHLDEKGKDPGDSTKEEFKMAIKKRKKIKRG